MTDNVLKLPLRANHPLPPRDERDWITSQELVAETSITYRQLDYWCRTHLLHPLEAHTPGSGTVRRFHAEQITWVRALCDLLEAGVSLQTCRQVIDEFATTGRVTVGAITITRTPGDAA